MVCEQHPNIVILVLLFHIPRAKDVIFRLRQSSAAATAAADVAKWSEQSWMISVT